MLWRGISEVEGAFGWKTPSSCHFAWYFFSIAIRVSRFSVCKASLSVAVNFGNVGYLRLSILWFWRLERSPMLSLLLQLLP